MKFLFSVFVICNLGIHFTKLNYIYASTTECYKFLNDKTPELVFPTQDQYAKDELPREVFAINRRFEVFRGVNWDFTNEQIANLMLEKYGRNSVRRVRNAED